MIDRDFGGSNGDRAIIEGLPEMTKSPVIFDCDGVLLDWERGFKHWVQEHYPAYQFASEYPASWELGAWIGCGPTQAMNLIQQFNQSEAFGRLLPMPHADETLYTVYRCHQPIYVLTSCSADPAVRRRRAENLERRFPTPIARVICLDLGVSKLQTLHAFYTIFGECIWVEDNYENAMRGVEVGHRSFLLRRPHNREHWENGPASLNHLDNLSDLMSLIK